MNKCNSGGYLVSGEHWLPTEPSDYYGAWYAIPAIGCNNLVCYRCKEVVRVEPLKGHCRTYACSCETNECTLYWTHLDTSDEVEPDPRPPWECAGHPTVSPPCAFAGVTIGSSPDWPAIVAAQLEAQTTIHPAIDRVPGFTLTRIYQALENVEDQRALALAIASHGNDPSLRARQAVALFFAQHRDATGLEQVLDAWRTEPALYDDHTTPWGSERKLKNDLLDAIRIRRKLPGGEALLATWRWAALRSWGLGEHVHWAQHIDEEWTNEHLEELIDLVPQDWIRFVLAVRVEFPMRFVPGLRKAIAEGHATAEMAAKYMTEKYGERAEPVIAALT